MIPKTSIYYSFAFLVLFFSIVSCETKKTELPTISMEQAFVANNIDQEYLQTASNKQWFFLLKVLQFNYKNTSDVEAWLLNKLEKKINNTKGLTDTLLKELHEVAFYKDYMKVAEKLARFTLNTAKGRMYKKSQVDAVANLSQYFNEVKEKDSLKKYVDLLNKYVKTDTTKFFQIVYHSSKANLESLNGDFFESVVHYHKAIDLTQSSEKLKLGTLYHNLATMYLNMDYLDKSKTYIDSSLVILSLDKYPTYLYNSLGIIQTKTKSYKEAEKTYQTIIRIAKEKQLTGLLAQSYANYGNLKRRVGNYSEALHFIQLSDSICNEMGIDFGKIINNINRAEVYYDQKQYTQAARTLKLIENEIKSFNLAEINKGFYELSYRVHDALGNKNIANTYFRYYTKNKETYIGDLPRSVISEWELSRERERGSQLTDKHNLIVYQQKQSNYYYAFIISLLSLGVVSIYFLMNKKRLKLQEFLKLKHQKMAFDLELKSKALLTESLKNISIQQSKSLIKADLVDVLKELPVEYRTKFNGLKGKLEATGLDAFLVDFENRFIGVYEVFYDKLKAISSDLTPNELIICAMLRLNYTSKEISYLTNRTPRTIENNRSIIRKKLNLETDVNLQQFIVNL